MKTKLLFGWMIAFSVSYLIGFVSYHIGLRLGEENGTWMAMLCGYLSMGFFIEALKTLKGEKTFWSYLIRRDKVIFTVSLIVFFVFLAYPIRKGEDSIIICIFFIVGLLISIFIIYFLASRDGRERILFIKA